MNRRRNGILVLLAAGLLVANNATGGESVLAVTPSAGGAVFLASEPVEMTLRTAAATVEWTATDYGGARTSGSAVIHDGAAVIRPGSGRVGYFDLHLSGRDERGREIGQTDTAFAVVRPPNGRSDSPFGVMTHFAQGWNPDLMPLLARAGITRLRDEQYWQEVETKRAAYVFPTRDRAYMAAAAANGLDPLIEMTFGNTNYDHQPDAPTTAFAPYTDDGREGYADYGKAILDQYGSLINALEVWNEYNGTWCAGPAAGDRPAYYASMLKTTYTRLKAARPDVTVLGGAAVLAPLPWFEDLFAQGALSSMDGVVIHPYRARPEGVENDVAALNAAMKSVNHGIAKPIWATECGNSGDLEPGRRASARYLVRLMTLMRSAGVARMYWYLARDYNEFTSGLLHDNDGRYTPTATYVAYANLIAQLNGAEPAEREPGLDPRTRVYRFRRGAQDVRVAWTLGSPTRLMFDAPGPLSITDIMGKTVEQKPVKGVVTTAIDENPVYLVGEVTHIQEAERTDRLAADAEEDFGAVEKGKGWSYGYIEPGALSVFHPMIWKRGPFGYQWQGPYAAMNISADGMHPGSDGGKPVWAVRRWRSDFAGVAHVAADVSLVSREGDGVGVKVLCDGKEVYNAALGGLAVAANARCDLSVPVAVGSFLDFVVTPGPVADINFDATIFRVQITASR